MVVGNIKMAAHYEEAYASQKTPALQAITSPTRLFHLR